MTLVEIMKKDWASLKNVEEMEILEKYAEHGQNLTLAYSGLCSSIVL